MRFASRQDAGRRLADFLRKRAVFADVVLGLPRGGVVVAAEIARQLQVPLDVLVVRKIGHPLQREFAVGALAEPGVVFLHEESMQHTPSIDAALDDVVAEEKRRLAEYVRKFHPTGMPLLEHKTVLLVDDGLATGATAEVAALSARQRKAQRIIVVAPVASTDAVVRLHRVADAVEVLWIDQDFQAVGQYYDEFSQTTDAEVISLLHDAMDRAA